MGRIQLLAGLGLSLILGCGTVTPDEMGSSGDPGPIGAPGLMGEPGEVGAPGVAGISCWDLDMNRICDPDEDIDQNDACDTADCRSIGPQGEAGPPGPPGPPGPSGAPGVQGERGLQGVPGVQGERGLQGVPGVQGERGLQGVPGVQGERGLQGPVGPPGSAGATGPAGPPGPGIANCTWRAQAGVNALCPAGKHVVTGGCSTTFASNPILRSAPLHESFAGVGDGDPITAAIGWECVFGGGPIASFAIALCCTVN
jgi:hypothetical protein